MIHPSCSLRVLMIGPSLESRGGMATVERQLVELLPENGVGVTFVPTYDDGGKAKKLAIAARAYARFKKELPSCDVVHVHMASRGSYERKRVFIRRAKKAGRPVAIHLHGGEFGLWYDEEMSDAKREEVKRLFAVVDAVIVLSEEWRDWTAERGFRARRAVVMHNGVNVPPQACTPCSHQDVLFLGRLDARKSPDVLLRASREALRANPSARLVFGGDGNVGHYRNMAVELGIADRCEFLGWVTGKDKERLFSEAGAYCLPSKNEGMPMSVLEAMAHGIPTIATPVGGVPQVIEDGVDGFLIPVDDERRLSELLCRLLGDPELRRNVGSAGREKISREFDVEKNIARLVDLYSELTGIAASVAHTE